MIQNQREWNELYPKAEKSGDERRPFERREVHGQNGSEIPRKIEIASVRTCQCLECGMTESIRKEITFLSPEARFEKQVRGSQENRCRRYCEQYEFWPWSAHRYRANKDVSSPGILRCMN